MDIILQMAIYERRIFEPTMQQQSIVDYNTLAHSKAYLGLHLHVK